MSKDGFEKELKNEQTFFNHFEEDTYGKYYYLIGLSITNFRFIDTWENEIIPYLESLQSGTGKINDWNSFPWKGIICFRKDHVMLLDESIEQVGRSLPGLKNEKGENIQNEEGECILDTGFIQENYIEYVKISLSNYIYYCKEWIKILTHNTSV